MSGPQLFTWFHADHRPLTQWLNDFTRSPLLDQLAATESVADVDRLIGELDARVSNAMPQPLQPGAISHPRKRPGPHRPGPTPGSSFPTERWLFEVALTGELAMLECWPDQNQQGLTPVGNRLDDEPTLAERRGLTLPAPRADDPNPAFAEFAYDTFLLTPALNQPQNSARHVYFTIDTTAEERRVHRASQAFSKAVEARREYLEAICQAINEQVAAYKRQVQDELLQFAHERRAQLDDDEALLESLSLSKAWTPPPPALDSGDPSQGHEHVARSDKVVLVHEPDVADADSQDQASTGEQARETLNAPIGQRLSSASFEDIQLIISGWAQGVHAYAPAFHSLWEDELSCLLTATLKATTPGADHQVYRRAGKTDILIRAKDLPDGHSDEPVFVCEAKKGGASRAAAALEDQLLGRYTTAQDTAAVLLLYLTNKDFVGARREALKAVRAVQGYCHDPEAEAHPTVEGWPVLAFRRRGRLMRVCVATIDVYYEKPPTERRTSNKRNK